VPYKSHLGFNATDGDCYSVFRAGHVPPKSQMFYQVFICFIYSINLTTKELKNIFCAFSSVFEFQICEIKVPELDILRANLHQKMEQGDLIYDSKFGFLSEGTLEFIRYVIIRHIELHLYQHGN